MAEVVVISGKGGTGKTTVTAALAHLAGKAVICDLDVDAPDLHLILRPLRQHSEEFFSGHQAVIDPGRCDGCGVCEERCRFEAISRQGRGMAIDPLRCEGCKVCVHFCPRGAIAFVERHCGSWFLSQTRFGPLVHAQLFPAQENSGRLVALLRGQAKELALRTGRNLILSDGAPGIGCPVISSLSGADLAVAVTEPTPSGCHDLLRVADLCAHFRVPVAVILNKHNLGAPGSAEVEGLCWERGLSLIARLPFDSRVVEAMTQAKTVTESGDGGVSSALRQGWAWIEKMLQPQAAA